MWSAMKLSMSGRRKRSICRPFGPVPKHTAGMRGFLRVAWACTQSIETPSHSATSRELSRRSDVLGNGSAVVTGWELADIWSFCMSFRRSPNAEAADRETLINLKWILGQMTVVGPCPAQASVGGVVLPKSLSKRLHGVPGIGKTEA